MMKGLFVRGKHLLMALVLGLQAEGGQDGARVRVRGEMG